MRKWWVVGWEIFILSKFVYEFFFDEDENFFFGYGLDVGGVGKVKIVLIRILNEKRGVFVNWYVNFEVLMVDEDV